ncbi:serine/threonine protein kinase [Actinomadura barringtoniae]|uniref:Serine/threonine protein kinase n=1 Tax=Actinomadura barringtoniae TaxID=1427535 RepID=A0A939PMF8_9ACTN|nr:serine/threonine-protein kinase [Actinomadura barringtoniae]MBO2455325.1 serine/threonine protein kinase [Actinomadura barringtoniae]
MTAVRPLQPNDPVWLGPYELVGRLGEGGQSVVYLGRNKEGRRAAVKLLRAQLSRHPEWRARFELELKVIGRVAGFCTAQVIDSDVEGDLPYVVSEYVPGPSLTELVTGQGPRTGTDLDRLAIGTVTALAAIHRAGILHRDFKPSNVLMGPDGPRVIDFGIARVLGAAAAKASGVVGTPAYMSPEQVTDGELGTGVDMFAWASTILFAATGRQPFGNDTISAVFHRIVNYEPDMSALPDSLREVVAACLSKDPAGRPSAQEALLSLLGREAAPETGGAVAALSTGAHLAGDDRTPSTEPGAAAKQPGSVMGAATPAPSTPARPSGAQPPSTIPPPPRRHRGWRLAAIVAAPLLVLGLAGATWALWPDSSSAGSPSDDSAAPPATAVAVVPQANEAVKSVLSWNYKTVDQNIATAHARSTKSFQAGYDQRIQDKNWKVALRDYQGTVTADVMDSAVVGAENDTVSVLAYVKQDVHWMNAAPQNTLEPMRITMVKQAGGSWLLDTAYPLNGQSVPLGSGSGPWPGGDARAAITTATSSAGGSLVEAGLRPGGTQDQVTAMVVTAQCGGAGCKAADKLSVHRIVVQRTGGAWKVGRTETL